MPIESRSHLSVQSDVRILSITGNRSKLDQTDVLYSILRDSTVDGEYESITKYKLIAMADDELGFEDTGHEFEIVSYGAGDYQIFFIMDVSFQRSNSTLDVSFKRMLRLTAYRFARSMGWPTNECEVHWADAYAAIPSLNARATYSFS